MDKSHVNIVEAIKHQYGNKLVNITGRTKEEQEQKDKELKEAGSLWPIFDILYQLEPAYNKT